jgi:RecA-family ATPase
MNSNAAPWFTIEPPQYKWLVDGLIPSSGYTASVGKPKSGKSTFLRTLIASIIENKNFLGRSVEVPEGKGVVLYIHIDRKDKLWQVAAELRDVLKITPEESLRIHLRGAEDLPQGSWPQRLEWLKAQVLEVKPTLIVIDLLWQFALAKNANDYKEVLDAINTLQQALESVTFDNALLVTMHGRKATNSNDEADDIIGSTAQRGSFGTGIFFGHDRAADRYTIFSDQTMRDPVYSCADKTRRRCSSDQGQGYKRRSSSLLYLRH